MKHYPFPKEMFLSHSFGMNLPCLRQANCGRAARDRKWADLSIKALGCRKRELRHLVRGTYLGEHHQMTGISAGARPAGVPSATYFCLQIPRTGFSDSETGL